MVIISDIRASIVLVILHRKKLRNMLFHSHSLYSMKSVIVLFAFPVKLNISTGKGVTKILPKKLYCHFH